MLPPEVSFVGVTPDQGSCSELAGTVTCLLGTVVDGDSVDVVITVTVPSDTPAGTITNNASVSTSTTDPVAGNDATTEDTAITTSADLSVTKVDSADPVAAGSSFFYTVTVANAGPSDALATTLTDTLPAGVTFTSAVPDQGACGELAGVVTCALGTVVAGDSVDVVITVGVPPATPIGTVLTNNVSVVTGTTDPVAGNDSDSEDTTVQAVADLTLTKTDSADPVLAGASFSYSVVVSNAGPSTATSVSVTDTLPAEVAFVSAIVTGGSGTESCSEVGGTVTCDLGDVAAASPETITIVVGVPASVVGGTVLSNLASVTAATVDPVPADNTDSEATTVSTSADISVAKSDSADPVVAGTGFSYTVSVSNAGPSDAASVSLTDVLPAGVVFVSATPDQGSCVEAAGTITCALGTVADGASVDVVIVVTVPADTAAGTITNNASVTTATTDPVAGNDSTSEDTAITTSADISVSKVDSADPVDAGTGFSYTVTVSNAGPSDAASVSLTDVLPPEVVYVSATPAQGSCLEAAGTVTCTLGTIADGASVDVVIAVSVPADTAVGTITNNASISTSTSDPVAGNDSISEDTTITASADLSVTKSDSADPVVAGTGFSYTVTVSNAGPSDAASVSLTDVLPPETAFVSATPDQGSCLEAAGTVTCTLGTIADGASVDVVIAVTVLADTAAGTITNNASVSSAATDPVAGNDSTSEDTDITTSADISVAKSDNADPVVAGTGFSYTVTVSNAGPSDAASVSLTDVLPAGVVYVSATPDQGSCSELAGTVTCSLGTIADGASVDVVIAVTVPADTAAGSITNNASVATATADPVAGNDATSEDTAISTSADISVAKSDSADPVVAGTGFSYTVTVSNAGPSDAASVSLSDVLPPEVAFVSATPDQGSCSELAGTVTCALGTIADGASVDVVIAVTVSADTAAGTITNNVSVSTATTDPIAGNDATSEDTTITTSADLSVSKLDSADPVVAGTGFSYTVTVSNAGPSDAATVSLSDVLPSEVAFVSATPDQGSCSELAGTVTCSLGTVANGDSVDVQSSSPRTTFDSFSGSILR